MKPAPFQYHRPSSLKDALAILSQVAEDDGRVLAGGQTLIPMMALRMAMPPHLVDINEISELSRVAVEGDVLIVGALARHARFERPVELGPTGKLMAEVCRHIAHYPIRTRGTLCGSLANADPASEWCMAAIALGATLRLLSQSGERLVRAQDFNLGAMTTDLQPDELIAEVSIPLLPADTRYGFYEFSRRAGDFALAMSLATLRLSDGYVTDANVAVGGAEDCPRRLEQAEEALTGRELNAASIAEAADAAAEAIDPMEDAKTSAAYRRDLVRTAVSRALTSAAQATPQRGHAR